MDGPTDPSPSDESGASLARLMDAVVGAGPFALWREAECIAGSPLGEGSVRLPLHADLVLELPDAPSAEAIAGLRALLGLSMPGVLTLHVTPEGQVEGVQGDIEQVLGLPPKAVVSAPFVSVARRVHPFDQGRVRAALAKATAGQGGQLTVRYRKTRENQIHLELTLIAPSAPHGTVALVARDVTDRESAREALAAAGRRERALLDAQPDGILRVRGDGRILELRPGQSQLPDGLGPLAVGGRVSEALARPHGSDLEAVVQRVVHTGGADTVRLDIDGRWWEARAVRGREGEALVLLRDTTDREQLLKDLVEAREHAEAASMEKSRFLANMSHEIRTPLNGVLGMTDLLLATPLDDEQRDLAQAAASSGQLLLALLNDLLDFSKIEAGQLDLESVRFDLVAALEEATALSAPSALRKGLDLVVDADPGMPSVAVGDPHRLRQIVVNLVSNAVKFTEQGSVRVKAHAVGAHRVRIEVQDTGIGIAEEAMSRLFVPFSQVDVSIARRFGGTGLGLAICRELVERMNGKVSVQTQLGHGSTFTVELRLLLEKGRRAEDRSPITDLVNRRIAVLGAASATQAALQRWLTAWGLELVGPSDAEVLLVGDTTIVPPEFTGEVIRLMPWGQRAEELALRLPFSRLRLLRAVQTALGLDSERESRARSPGVLLDGHVLVVEDNLVNQRVAEGLLRRFGVRVTLAGDGSEALNVAQRERFDLILMDLQMPGMGGFEATRRLRERGVQTPVVALTADALPGDRRRCLDAGMDGHLGKPVSPSQLRACLETWLVRRALPRQRSA